jgi:hypothetical protein
MVESAELSVNLYQTSWCNNPEDNHLHTRHRENLRSHKDLFLMLNFITRTPSFTCMVTYEVYETPRREG